MQKEDIWKDVLTSCGDEYKDLSEAWKQVETKAQSVTAIAGIFLAAAFSWVRELPVGFQPIDRAVLCLAMLVLVASIGVAILAMRIRGVSLPPHGRLRLEMADALEARAFDQEGVCAFYQALIDSWEEVNTELVSTIQYKAGLVFVSQMLLGYSAVLCFILAVRAVMEIAS